MLKGFRDFISRGNVIDLAVAVVIGAAFTTVVNAFVNNLINPIIGAFGSQNLNHYYWCLKGTCSIDAATGNVKGVAIGWGAVLSAVITFALTAAVVYFVFVLPMNKYRQFHTTAAEEETLEEITLLREIRDALVADREAPRD